MIFDTYAWIEYFLGSKKGKKVKKIIESKEEIITPSLVLAEIKQKYEKEGRDYRKRIFFLTRRSLVVDISQKIALLAGNLKNKYKLYMIDALIYAVAIMLNEKLLTGDKHLINLPNVEKL